MDRKLFVIFAGGTVIGFAYTIRRIIQLERLHDSLCDVLAKEKDEEIQQMVDVAFEDIVDNYEEGP